MSKKIVVAITGASGALYAKLLLDSLQKCQSQFERVDIILSDNARDVWQYELGNSAYENYSFKILNSKSFFEAPASGSASYSHMVICPASMGSIGRIAHGISNDLITRAADVMLKERRKLIIIPRESPLNLIHLKNMSLLTEAGAIILPASPSFYHKPKSIEELTYSVVHRIIRMLDIDIDHYEWGKSEN